MRIRKSGTNTTSDFISVGDEATSFFQGLGRRMQAVTRETMMDNDVSLAVQKGNADCVLGTEHWEEEETLQGF